MIVAYLKCSQKDVVWDHNGESLMKIANMGTKNKTNFVLIGSEPSSRGAVSYISV